MLSSLWPSHDTKGKEWQFLTSYEARWKRWIGEDWRSPDVQRKEAFFEIDLRKERSIIGIQFYSRESFEIPRKWYMTIQSRSHALRFFDTNLVRKQGEGAAIVFFKTPQKVQFIRIVIVEPEIGKDGQYQYWTISEIRFKEIRVRHMWEPVVK